MTTRTQFYQLEKAILRRVQQATADACRVCIDHIQADNDGCQVELFIDGVNLANPLVDLGQRLEAFGKALQQSGPWELGPLLEAAIAERSNG